LEHAIDGDGAASAICGIRRPTRCLRCQLSQTIGLASGRILGRGSALAARFAYEQAEPRLRKPIAEWAKLGVRSAAGEALPDINDEAAILLPAVIAGRRFWCATISTSSCATRRHSLCAGDRRFRIG